MQKIHKKNQMDKQILYFFSNNQFYYKFIYIFKKITLNILKLLVSIYLDYM